MRRTAFITETWSRFRKIVPFVKPHTWLFIFSLSLTLISSLLALVNPYLLKLFFDDVLINRRFDLFYLLLGIFVVVFIVTRVLGYFHTIISTKFSQRVNLGVRLKMFEHLQSQDMQYLQQQQTGDLITRFESDTTSVLSFVSLVFNSGLISLVRAVAIAAVSMTLSLHTTLIALAAFPFYFLCQKFYIARMKRKRKSSIKQTARIIQFLHEKLPRIKTSQLFTREHLEVQNYQRVNQSRNLLNLQIAKLNSVSGIVSSSILYIPSIVVLAFGGYSVLQGVLTVGALIALRSYIQDIFGPLTTLTNLYRDLHMNSISLDRVLAVIARKPSIVPEIGAKRSGAVQGAIEFRNVAFQYGSDKPVLDNLNIVISPGETVGIMGCSGEGKSTISDLLCRFYDPILGSVFVDGMDVRHAHPTWLRRRIGVVSQDSLLFDCSVKKNILIGGPRASHADVVRAAKIAGAHEFITALPKGYATHVQESGCRLSTGQQQRISIARTILKNPAIVVLDEATSALDPRCELHIRGVIADHFRDRTCIVISHRISTLLDCDRILMLKDGQIVESGTCEELLLKRGLFREFYDSQISPIDAFTPLPPVRSSFPLDGKKML